MINELWFDVLSERYWAVMKRCEVSSYRRLMTDLASASDGIAGPPEPCSAPASSATSAIGFHSNRAAANRAAGRV